MSHVTDWTNLGILPLQDHDSSTEIDMRLMVTAMRVKDVDLDATGNILSVRDALDRDLGTVGDVHPWRYWPMQSRGHRPMGSWAMAFACEIQGQSGPVTTPGGGGTGRPDPVYTGPADSVPPGARSPYLPAQGGSSRQESASARPIRRDNYKGDARYKVITHKLPPGLSRPPEGSVAIALAGTEEQSEERLLIPLEGSLRLIAVNWSPPGDMGTRVFDLEPDGTIAPWRGARLQSMMRVIRMAGPQDGLVNADDNGLAWQLTVSQQDRLAGYGMAYGKLDASVPGLPDTKKEPGPTSGTPNPNTGLGAVSSGGHFFGPAGGGGVGPGNVPGVRDGVWNDAGSF